MNTIESRVERIASHIEESLASSKLELMLGYDLAPSNAQFLNDEDRCFFTGTSIAYQAMSIN